MTIQPRGLKMGHKYVLEMKGSFHIVDCRSFGIYTFPLPTVVSRLVASEDASLI